MAAISGPTDPSPGVSPPGPAGVGGQPEWHFHKTYVVLSTRALATARNSSRCTRFLGRLFTAG
jgi:hypothetical protein